MMMKQMQCFQKQWYELQHQRQQQIELQQKIVSTLIKLVNDDDDLDMNKA